MGRSWTLMPGIDKKTTQRRVEHTLETVRVYKKIGFVRRESKITPNYEPKYHGPTNKISLPTEDCAVWNVEKEKYLQQLAEQVDYAVSCLEPREREIIEKRYLLQEDMYDYIVYSELGLSERQYYRVKSEAFFKLAYMLRLEAEGKKSMV